MINADLANAVRAKRHKEEPLSKVSKKAIVRGKTSVMPKFFCENSVIPNTEELKKLRVTGEDKMKF